MQKLVAGAAALLGKAVAPKTPQEAEEEEGGGKLPTVAGWSAAGFTALAGILTFFSIREGALDRLLRSDAEGALLVFCLVGAGLLAAILSAAAQVTFKVNLFAVLVLVTAIGWFASTKFRDIGPDQSLSTRTIAVAVMVLVVALLVVGHWQVSAVTALLILAMSCTSLGLYGAAKLSVLHKRDAVGNPVKVVLVEGPPRTVELTVSAFGMDKEDLEVAVKGRTEGGEDQEIARYLFEGDEVGAVDETVSIPVDLSRWKDIKVTRKGPGDDEWVQVAVLPGDLRPLGVSGRLKLKGQRMIAKVQVRGLDDARRVEVSLVRAGAAPASSPVRIAGSTLTAQEEGVARWTTKLGARTSGIASEFELRYRECAGSSCEPDQVLATISAREADGEPAGSGD